MSDAFSQTRQEILEDFANLSHPRDEGQVNAIWSRHYHALQSSRGIFVVANPLHEKALPGDRDFGDSGFLRSWMSSTRLMLIQNREDARPFQYCASISCDTNFASFCEAYDSGRSLGAHQNAFEDAIRFLLPIVEGTNIFPYLIENAENPNRDKVRATLRAFAAFKLTSTPLFAATGRFTHCTASSSSDQIADGCLAAMEGPDFKILYAWMKRYFLWARIVLLKCALVVFRREALTLESKLYALLEFLHERMARLPQFEMLVGYRYFALNTGTSFFKGVQLNARHLNRTLNSMAWDMAHWRSLFDMLLIHSNRGDFAAFPIPHFLTFDQPFERLTEGLRLDGLIYAPVRRRCEQIPNDSLVRSVSELLHGSCHEFCKPEARNDRARRALEDHREDDNLVVVESELSRELEDAQIESV